MEEAQPKESDQGEESPSRESPNHYGENMEQLFSFLENQQKYMISTYFPSHLGRPLKSQSRENGVGQESPKIFNEGTFFNCN